MKIEEQVCSLELAKRLKELGVNQETYLVWNVPVPSRAREGGERRVVEQSETTLEVKAHENRWGICFDDFSAFTVAEFGEMLPEAIRFRTPYKVSLPERVDGEWVFVVPIIAESKLETTTAKSEADARAKMLIYLIENKLATF